jgi:hypothetical protein
MEYKYEQMRRVQRWQYKRRKTVWRDAKSASGSSAKDFKPHDQANIGMASKGAIDKMILRFFDKVPDWLWEFMSKKALSCWGRVDACLICHFWRARLYGWRDCLIIFLIVWGFYEFIR